MLHLYLMTYIQEEKKWKEYGGGHIRWCAIKKKKIAENVGKYLVTKQTEETPKTTCTGNQPWAARFVENIFDTRETEDTLQKTTCKILSNAYNDSGIFV